MVSTDRRTGDRGPVPGELPGGEEERLGSIRSRLREMESRHTFGGNSGFLMRQDPETCRHDRPGRNLEPRLLRPTLEELSGGREVETSHGKVFEIVQSFLGAYRHGKYRLDEFGSTDLGAIDLLCRGAGALSTVLRYAQAEDFLFLDLETTGLSLGTGTYAFLVGLGYFRNGRYQVKQFLLRSFPEEPCMIANIKDFMEGFGVLVTFNGKRFDLPVLETRFAICGKTLAADRMVHWDLMYPSRRFWQDREENCRLGTLERTQLGVDRGLEDIPGSRIPEVYYRYVHHGECLDLERVLYHNTLDVLSLTTLAIHTARCLAEKDPAGVNLLRLGRFFDRAGLGGAGRECYEIAARFGSCPDERDEALFRLAMRMKREGARREAMEILEGIVDRGGARLLDSCEEIAKFYEHDLRDAENAMGFVLVALEIARPDELVRRERLLRRLGRLERKRGTG